MHTLGFLMDVVNDLAGYDDLFHLKRTKRSFTKKELIRNEHAISRKLYEKQMRERAQAPRKASEEGHPHIVMAIHGCDRLWNEGGVDPRGQHLLESFILRLYVSTILTL